MKSFRSFRLLVPALIATGLCAPCHLPAAEPPPDPAKLGGILLNSVADTWDIKPATFTISGEPAIVSTTAQGVRLESKSTLPASTDYFFAFRLKPAKGATSTVQIQMASGTTPDNKPLALNFNVSLKEGQTNITYAASVTGTTAPGAKPPVSQSGTQHLVGVTERSLGWPEDLRRIVESELAAATKPEEMLQTVRCTVEKGRYRAWVNGRYLCDIALEEGMDPAGLLKISLGLNAELVTVRTRRLETPPAKFEPISIAGNLTGSTVASQKLDASSLPALGPADAWPFRTLKVDGIPFELPKPAANGNDHLDVGTSWTRFGAIAGYISANHGSFGGRWISADRLDPSRHCLYVPTGRYKALHLIAVAEERPDSVPIVTAQFYRPAAGHPFNFASPVPTAAGAPGKAKAVPIKLTDGSDSKLYHVTIPLDPDAFSWFTDLPRIGLEITKEVRFYRGYPDPLEYSWHGAGLPSSVQIYAMTLERAGIDLDLDPTQFGHVWTAPATPGYTFQLRNGTAAATKAKLVITTKSQDGQDMTKQEQEADLPAGGTLELPVSLKPTRYGMHELTVTMTAAGETSTFRRNFAYLHPDTRDRTTWQDGQGSVFGFWPWKGGHVTPNEAQEIEIMAAAGAETSTSNYALSKPEIQALAEKHHFIGEAAFHGGIMYETGFTGIGKGPKFDPTKPEETAKALIEAMKINEARPGPISRPTHIPFFAEPQIGNITTGIWPSHYGENYELAEYEQKKLDDMKAKFVLGARAIRKEWPNYKLLMPYGDPMNTVVFLKKAPETRGLIDGVALDIPGFERMPEQQVNQVVLNRLFPIMKDIKEHLPKPYLALVEGFCVSSKDIDTGDQGQEQITMRDFLVLMGYGLTRFEATNAPFDCANYWGENHYGGGWNSRLPLATPKLAYVSYATMTRHLNRANFTKYVPTGSTSTYCQQFRHYKTGKLIHVLWNIRGQRPVSVKVPAGAKLSLYDPQDNITELPEKNGAVTFKTDQSPRYLEGLTADAEITLGETDHSDAKPAKEAVKIASFGDGSWAISSDVDPDYTKNKPQQIERFPEEMTIRTEAVPPAQGTKALAIHLESQEKDRGVMPYYTTLAPKAPMAIPGRASHLGLWVKAASDWGRVVYVLRDAKGEKWISVGTREDWNNDDIHCWSAFCFDGWRYLRFQLPGSLPYDSYRLHGTSWWGSTGGDGVVDLPLQLEKVMVERRPKVIYGNDLVAAKPDDVLLGDAYAEYERPADRTEEAVRLSNLRMPTPKNAPELSNPIVELEQSGVGAPTKVLRVTDPASAYDGTRGHVHFEPVAGAKSYDIWVSPYKDGRGALHLGKAWKESGQLLQGLHADTEFHLFVTYIDAENKVSKPSAPFAFRLKDRFGYK